MACFPGKNDPDIPSSWAPTEMLPKGSLWHPLSGRWAAGLRLNPGAGARTAGEGLEGIAR